MSELFRASAPDCDMTLGPWAGGAFGDVTPFPTYPNACWPFSNCAHAPVLMPACAACAAYASCPGIPGIKPCALPKLGSSDVFSLKIVGETTLCAGAPAPGTCSAAPVLLGWSSTCPQFRRSCCPANTCPCRTPSPRGCHWSWCASGLG